MWRPSIIRKRSDTSIFSSKPTGSSTESLVTPKPPSPRRLTIPSRSTLSEVLRNNPFRTPGRDVSPAAELVPEDPGKALNDDLKIVATVYPDVQLDVIRELLCRFDGESRLKVCVEQLFRYKTEWARGRLVNPPRDADDVLSQDELFRNRDYVEASKRTLYAEFKSLNRSAVDAVLAEVNNSYTKARPVLQEIIAKTWRATLTNLFRKARDNQEAPIFLLERQRNGDCRLLCTGNKELDLELDQLYLRNSKLAQNSLQQEADFDIASELNLRLAEEEHALFECQCCYDEVPFEQSVACNGEGHIVCLNCVRHSLTEAVFGQGWSKSINTSQGTLNCLAPVSVDECTGQISQYCLHRAITSMKSGSETWAKFEQRLATDSLTKSGLSLQHCPFCSYAEVAETYTMKSISSIQWRFRAKRSTMIVSIAFCILFFQPIALGLMMLFLIAVLARIFLQRPSFQLSLINLCNRKQTQRFICRSPTCAKKSCVVCSKQWHDPHVCDEPLIFSLRNAVEAARTAALKRVCPRCGTGFVKDSGCNKLVCPCGYAMCYLCRKNIGKAPSVSGRAAAFGLAMNWNPNLGLLGRNQAQADIAAEEEQFIAAGEGYRHFCPHFRPLPGQKCTECDKCDLYKSEDEDAIVRRAGELAEREWRERYERDMDANTAGDKPRITGLEKALEGIDDEDNGYFWEISKRGERMLWKLMSDVRRGRLGPQGILDWVVDKLVVVESGRT